MQANEKQTYKWKNSDSILEGKKVIAFGIFSKNIRKRCTALFLALLSCTVIYFCVFGPT